MSSRIVRRHFVTLAGAASRSVQAEQVLEVWNRFNSFYDSAEVAGEAAKTLQCSVAVAAKYSRFTRAVRAS